MTKAEEPLLIDELGEYKVGDEVYAPFKYGTITAIYNDGRTFPIEVTWELSTNNAQKTNVYTADGYAFGGYYEGAPKLTVIERPLSKEDKIVDTKGRGFKVGDKVQSRKFGVGVVDEILTPEYPYPVIAKWTKDGTYSAFTSEGHYYPQRADAEKDITLLEGEGKAKTDAIDPAHYRVKGIPEAIEIMEHLMTKEQLEGFLWGNIIKYAYRYGRKGDKAETAGKIKWYAQRLEELKECRDK